MEFASGATRFSGFLRAARFDEAQVVAIDDQPTEVQVDIMFMFTPCITLRPVHFGFPVMFPSPLEISPCLATCAFLGLLLERFHLGKTDTLKARKEKGEKQTLQRTKKQKRRVPPWFVE